jgi:Domain of unknown function (DUF4352)
MTLTIDRNMLIGLVVGLIIGIGGTLLVAGGDDDDGASELREGTSVSVTGGSGTPSAAEDIDSVAVGEVATSGGIEMTVNQVRTEPSVTYEGGVSSSITPNAKQKTITAPQGGTYIYVDTTITNNTSKGIDITCSFPVDAKVVDDSGRKFDPIESQDQIRGNPECNALLQPGFEDEMTWVFLVPPDARIMTFEFSDVTNLAKAAPRAEVTLPEL